MGRRFRRPEASAMLEKAVWAANDVKELTMRWETPQAVELRFGMEITMYISNR